MAETDDSKEKQTKVMEIITAGLDSMATMQLVIRIEQNFGLKLPAGKITKENFSTVAALARII